ncbi:MAG: ABC transporter substrate-binding protein, partial [Halomonas sp.]|nr:ABC transporter substrate-binding protein [Halomonas sp.]
MTLSHRKTLPLRPLSAALLTASLLGASAQALAQEDPIKVGILHSLSGTMAISETVLKDTVEMLIEQQNEKGG